MEKICPICNGTGKENKLTSSSTHKLKDCNTCEGLGYVIIRKGLSEDFRDFNRESQQEYFGKE